MCGNVNIKVSIVSAGIRIDPILYIISFNVCIRAFTVHTAFWPDSEKWSHSLCVCLCSVCIHNSGVRVCAFFFLVFFCAFARDGDLFLHEKKNTHTK